MSGFELNKILGAVLGTLLVVVSLRIISEGLFVSEAPEKPGYQIAVATEEQAPAEGTAAPEAKPIAELLASADPQAGAGVFRRCEACHSSGKGEPAKVGPNLWNVVGGPIGHMEGFGYSPAMQERHAAGDTWTYENLDHFLTKPSGFIPGTKMTFAGLPKPEDRANVIAYLRTLSDNPPPLPTPQASAPAGAGEAGGLGSDQPASQETPDQGQPAQPEGGSQGEADPSGAQQSPAPDDQSEGQ